MKMRIEVRYHFEKPEMEFDCPFCDTNQSRRGGHISGGRFYPSPMFMVEDHLWGDKGCPKFTGIDGDLDYDALGVCA
jgi:hypothetical protein